MCLVLGTKAGEEELDSATIAASMPDMVTKQTRMRILSHCY